MLKHPKSLVFTKFKKLFQIVLHPLFIIIFFLMIHINGAAVSGYYFQFLLFGDLLIKPFALVGNIAWLLIFMNFIINRKRHISTKYAINIIAITFMLASIYLFFSGDKEKYYYYTFLFPVPLLIFIIFLLLSLTFLFFQIVKFYRGYYSNFN
jgi:hypothetical protein